MRVVPISSPGYVVCVGDTKLAVAAETDCLSYSSLTSEPPTASTRSSQGSVRRWLADYPRLGFMLVLVACTCVTGMYSSYLIARLTLRLTGATAALHHANAERASSVIELQRINQCVVAQALGNVVESKAEIELARSRWQKVVQRQRRRIDTARQNVATCIDRRITPINEETTHPETLSCLMDGMLDVVVNTNSSVNGVSRYATKLGQQLAAARQRQQELATRRTVLERLASLASNATNDTMSLLSDGLRDLRQSLAGTLTGFAVDLPLPDLEFELPDANVVGWMPMLQLLGLLRAAVGADNEVGHVYNRLTQSWVEIEKAMHKLSARGAALRREFKRVANATEVRVASTISAVDHAAVNLGDAVSTKLQKSVGELMDEITRLFAVEPQYAGRNHMEDEKLEVVADEELVLMRNDTEAMDQVILDTKSSTNATAPALKLRRDGRKILASIAASWSTVISVILVLDFLMRLQWFVHKTTALFTESYLDIEPVDIRDVAPITTLLDLKGVLLCRHNLIDVLYTIATDGAYMLEAAIYFVLWVLLAVGGTMGMIEWRQHHVDRCHRHATTSPADEYGPQLNVVTWVRQLIENETASSPINSMEKATRQLETTAEREQQRWRSEMADVQRRLEERGTELVLLRRLLADLEGVGAHCTTDSTPTCDLEIDVGALAVDTMVDASLVHPREWRETIAIACFPVGDKSQPVTAPMLRLEYAHGCVSDQALYLSTASWWMVLIYGLSLRMIGRMVVKSLGLTWWSWLGDGRLHFIGYCNDQGETVLTERLPKAVRRHLRNVRWRVGARMVGVVLAVTFAVAVSMKVLPRDVMEPPCLKGN